MPVLLATASFAVSARALDTLALLEGGAAKELLENRKPILATIEGEVPVSYAKAVMLFERPAFLQDIQDAYAEELAEDGTPEFTIHQTSSNTYFYVNKNGERTDIEEVVRKTTEDGSAMDLVFYSTGKRSFGNYRALIHAHMVSFGTNTTHFKAVVYAYPENAVGRFLARHLGIVERYFRGKTGEMTGIITTIAQRMCESESEASGNDA